MAIRTAITMLVLAVAGIVVVSSGTTIKDAKGDDGQGSFSAGGRTLTTPVRCFILRVVRANTRYEWMWMWGQRFSQP